MDIPYAKLCRSSNGATYEHRYIYFNPLATNLFQGKEYALLYKPESGKYIVCIPLSDIEAMENPSAQRLSPKGKSAIITCSRFASSGLINNDLFGKRYKVRLDRKGRVYVCLQEQIVDGGGGDGLGRT